ncbi:hypothetical protein G6514_001750 [Epicoccum nigrum]|nr:hypothetical protein G6514_001750 [Epicoccum nigrum]
MYSQQFVDLPQIFGMDEAYFSGWPCDSYTYSYVEKQEIPGFSVVDDNIYADGLDQGMMSMQPMQRFMFDQSPQSLGASISLKEIEYAEQEPEPTVEDADIIDIKQEPATDYTQLHNKRDTEDSVYKDHTESEIGISVRDAESVQPLDCKDEMDADSDYTPTRQGSGKRRRSAPHTTRISRRRSGARKDSVVSSSSSNKSSRRSRGTKKPNGLLYYNDFNRKDLFTQHLRRMHAAQGSGARHSKEHPVTEENIGEHQERCYLQLRRAPQQSICPFNGCDVDFIGPRSWEERMEHVGRHLEKDRDINELLNTTNWKHDGALEKYLVDQDLITWEIGGWRISDGRGRRSHNGSSDDD